MKYALLEIYSCSNNYKAKKGLIKCKILRRNLDQGTLLIQAPFDTKPRMIKDDEVLQIIDL